MAVNNKKTRSALGNIPLNKGIFQKTEPTTTLELNQESRVENPESTLLNQESRVENPESILLNQESRVENPESVKNREELVLEELQSNFLNSESEKEKVNFRIPIELNDWLDDLVKRGKRLHGSKIPKEIWVQGALELFQKLSIDWESIKSIDDLRYQLTLLESRINNQES